MNADNSHITQDKSKPEGDLSLLQEGDLVIKKDQGPNHIYRIEKISKNQATFAPKYADKSKTRGSVFAPHKNLRKATEKEIERAKNLVRHDDMVHKKGGLGRRPAETYKVLRLDRHAGVATVEPIYTKADPKKENTEPFQIALNKLVKGTEESIKKSRRFYRPHEPELDSSIVDQFKEGDAVLYTKIHERRLIRKNDTSEQLCRIGKIVPPSVDHTRGKIELVDYHKRNKIGGIILLENIAKASESIIKAADKTPPRDIFTTGSIVVIHDPDTPAGEEPEEIVVRLRASSKNQRDLHAAGIHTSEDKGVISDITKILREARSEEKRTTRTTARAEPATPTGDKPGASSLSRNEALLKLQKEIGSLTQTFTKFQSTSERIHKTANSSRALAHIPEAKGLPNELSIIHGTISGILTNAETSLEEARKAIEALEADNQQTDEPSPSDL